MKSRLSFIASLMLLITSQTLLAEPAPPQMQSSLGQARNGTVSVVLSNIAALNKLLFEPSTQETERRVQQMIDSLKSMLNSIHAIGLFNLFVPQEWLRDPSKPGRIMVAALYLQKYPEEITPAIQIRLDQLIDQENQIPRLANELAKARDEAKKVVAF